MDTEREGSTEEVPEPEVQGEAVPRRVCWPRSARCGFCGATFTKEQIKRNYFWDHITKACPESVRAIERAVKGDEGE